MPVGASVRYRLGVEERDRYGRALAYVWLDDGRFLNRMLVRRGFAQPLTVPPNVEYEDIFVRAARRGARPDAGCGGVQAAAGSLRGVLERVRTPDGSRSPARSPGRARRSWPCTAPDRLAGDGRSCVP